MLFPSSWRIIQPWRFRHNFPLKWWCWSLKMLIFTSSASLPVYMCALQDLIPGRVQVLYICTRAIKKVRFPILFLLKRFLHRVGKHGFCQYIYSPPYSSSRKVCCRWVPHQLTWLTQNDTSGVIPDVSSLLQRPWCSILKQNFCRRWDLVLALHLREQGWMNYLESSLLSSQKEVQDNAISRESDYCCFLDEVLLVAFTPLSSTINAAAY